ncbi:MAG: class I ribonucleotide reductase maintenance protein YfaE [Buchnera aphidicola (Nurudea yanoniella)]
MSYSKIKIYNNNRIIYYKFKKTPLRVILQTNNINIEYQCTQGYCGTCRIKLIKGTIYYKNKNVPLASQNPGDIFPCCCIAQGNIEIKI